MKEKKTARVGRSTRIFALCAVVIAAVIVLNLVLQLVPSGTARPDISNRGLYDISDTTKEMLANLDQDIDLTLIADPENVDPRVTQFLKVYTALSDRLHYTFINLVDNPTAPETYNTSANAVTVRCEATGKQTEVFTAGFYGYGNAIVAYDPEAYMSYQQYVEAYFDGDGQMTAAINYVTSDVDQTIYTLGGHGEADLSPTVAGMIEKLSLTLADEPLNLLMAGSIPEDCDLLIINNPTSDLTEDELDMLLDHLTSGGRVILIIQKTTEMEHFSTLMRVYGMELQQGFLGDTSRTYAMYASRYGFFCFAPTLSRSNEITSGITANSILFYPAAMVRVDPARSSITVNNFMTTSEQGYLYVDENTESEPDTYVIGAVATEPTDSGEARLTVITSMSLISEDFEGLYSDMSNMDIFMNAVTANFDEVVANTAIPPISLSVDYITVGTPGLWATLFVVAIPLGTLIFGLVYWLRRRKR